MDGDPDFSKECHFQKTSPCLMLFDFLKLYEVYLENENVSITREGSGHHVIGNVFGNGPELHIQIIPICKWIRYLCFIIFIDLVFYLYI